MASKSIFTLASAYLRQAAWQRQDGEEWVYVRAGKDYNLVKANQIIHSTITGNEIFYLTDRHKSKPFNLDQLISSLRSRVETVDFLIWDLLFEAVVEVHTIGVARKGFRDNGS